MKTISGLNYTLKIKELIKNTINEAQKNIFENYYFIVDDPLFFEEAFFKYTDTLFNIRIITYNTLINNLLNHYQIYNQQKLSKLETILMIKQIIETNNYIFNTNNKMELIPEIINILELFYLEELDNPDIETLPDLSKQKITTIIDIYKQFKLATPKDKCFQYEDLLFNHFNDLLKNNHYCFITEKIFTKHRYKLINQLASISDVTILMSLLYAINGGVDEKKGIKVVPDIQLDTDEVLDYPKVLGNYKKVLSYVAELYVDTINIIHYMHDKYAYESSQMALHDTLVERLAAFGVAGLSIAADSLSAIKFAKVRPIRNENGIAVDFQVEGDFPKYGNDDDRVDDIAVELVSCFSAELKKHPLYRNAIHTLSALTITSNVMYGKKTGATPDGRKAGEPFAPGANPMHGRDKNGALSSLNSVAKIPYRAVCQDGVSNTFSIVPSALGKSQGERVDNLVHILDGYFLQGAHHLNVNVMNRQLLVDAMEHPEQYPTLTIRVSGYAVNFSRLSREQQMEVIKRTFHEQM